MFKFSRQIQTYLSWVGVLCDPGMENTHDTATFPAVSQEEAFGEPNCCL